MSPEFLPPEPSPEVPHLAGSVATGHTDTPECFSSHLLMVCTSRLRILEDVVAECGSEPLPLPPHLQRKKVVARCGDSVRAFGPVCNLVPEAKSGRLDPLVARHPVVAPTNYITTSPATPLLLLCTRSSVSTRFPVVCGDDLYGHTQMDPERTECRSQGGGLVRCLPTPLNDIAKHAGKGRIQVNPGSYTNGGCGAPSWEQRTTNINHPKAAVPLVTNPPATGRSSSGPSLCAELSLRSPVPDRSATPGGAVPETTQHAVA
jgi:hypothetical protein